MWYCDKCQTAVEHGDCNCEWLESLARQNKVASQTAGYRDQGMVSDFIEPKKKNQPPYGLLVFLTLFFLNFLVGTLVVDQ
jgi:hypothetical protein